MKTCIIEKNRTLYKRWYEAIFAIYQVPKMSDYVNFTEYDMQEGLITIYLLLS